MKGKQGFRLSPIFKLMKIGAAIFILITGFFTVAPALRQDSSKAGMSTCAKSRGCCHKKETDKKKKQGCEGMNCNLFVYCPYCSMYLVPGPSVPCLPAADKEKTVISNDNRTIKSLSDFWHPPNVV